MNRLALLIIAGLCFGIALTLWGSYLDNAKVCYTCGPPRTFKIPDNFDNSKEILEPSNLESATSE